MSSLWLTPSYSDAKYGEGIRGYGLWDRAVLFHRRGARKPEAKQGETHCDSAVESRIVRGQARWRSRAYTSQFQKQRHLALSMT